MTPPERPPAKFLMARDALQRGDPRAAAALLDRVAKEDPRVVLVPAFQHTLARALAGMGTIEPAIEAYRQAIKLAPDAAQSYEELAMLLHREQRLPEAVALLREAGEAAPSRTGFRLLAILLTELGRHEESVEADRRAVALEPGFAPSHEMLGAGLQALGRFDEALQCYRTAAALDPSRAGPYYRLTRIKKITADDAGIVERLEAIAARPEAPKEELRLAHYGLGKAYEDMARYQEAAKNFRLANRYSSDLQHAGRRFDTAAHTRWVDRLVETFDAAFFESHSAIGADSEAPIFVIGMIRSGTTLVEQVISSHSRVFGGGEIGFWTGRRSTELTQDAMGGRLDSEMIRLAASDYLLEAVPPDEAHDRFTDKMPLNYLALGLIHLALPKARFVHCVRNPFDTCLSIYTTPFPTGAEFCYDPRTIVSVYRDYRRLMRHWRQTLPAGSLFEVTYEDLVANPEDVIRRLIDFCGLPWDPACLRHQENERGVLTPSNWQARQAIYSGSVGRWAHFGPWLTEFTALRDLP